MTVVFRGVEAMTGAFAEQIEVLEQHCEDLEAKISDHREAITELEGLLTEARGKISGLRLAADIISESTSSTPFVPSSISSSRPTDTAATS